MRANTMRQGAKLAFLIMLILTSGSFSGAEEYIQAQAEIGIKTAASGGRYTVSQVAQIAGENGVSVVITTDAFLNRWQYGLWPLRSIIKKTEETRSLSTYGILRYLEEIKQVQRKNPGMVIIGGLEVSPLYYWEGDIFRNNFAIKDWHKHLLVIGLEGLQSYRSLPVIGNPMALVKPFGIKNLLCLLVPIAMLLAGLYCVREGKKAEDGVYERRLGLPLAHWYYVGIALLTASLIFFVNAFPFRNLEYDQYHGYRGAIPYQNLIDYVNKHGGMTFWAHPEAKNIEKIGAVSVQTSEHAGLLIDTCGYTGFAIFYEGYDIVGRPQGIWDSVLRRYCQGGCASPVWAIGTLDYETSGNLNENLGILRTVLLVKEMTGQAVLDALKKGRMYVAKDANAAHFRLDSFSIEDSSGRSATMGEEIDITGSARIKIKGSYVSDKAAKMPLKVLLIRDGEQIAQFEVEAPFDIIYDDKETAGSGKRYYRAEVRSSGLVLVTNPVFVARK